MATTKAHSKGSTSATERPQKAKQDQSFEAVAKRLGCDDDKKRFEAKLGKIARAKLKTGEK